MVKLNWDLVQLYQNTIVKELDNLRKYEKPVLVDLQELCKEGICFNGGGDRVQPGTK